MAEACDQGEERWSWIKSWEFLGQLCKPNCFKIVYHWVSNVNETISDLVFRSQEQAQNQTHGFTYALLWICATAKQFSNWITPFFSNETTCAMWNLSIRFLYAEFSAASGEVNDRRQPLPSPWRYQFHLI